MARRIVWQDKVVIDPSVHHGDPCIRGTRVPVSVIVGGLADGMTAEEIRGAYPRLTLEEIQASLAYAAEVLRHEVLSPL